MQKEYTRPRTRPLAHCLVLGVVICVGACRGNSPRDASAGPDATTAIAGGNVAPAVRRDASGARGTSTSGGHSGSGLVGLVPTLPRSQSTARIVPSGTALTLVSNARVCTNTYHPGDTFTATVTDTVTVSSAAVVPAGSLANFQVTEITPALDGSRARGIGIALDSLAIDGVRYPAGAHITSIVTRKVRSTPIGRPGAAPVGAGVESADILGVIMSHSDRSTLIGARQASSNPAGEGTTDFCIPRDGRITLTLTTGEQLQ